MAMTVCNGATLACNMGSAPSSMGVLPDKMCNSAYQAAANIMDHKPMINIRPFGVCRSLGFPATAGATAAAQGALTPMPCMPNTPAPWAPGSVTVMMNHQPTLNNTSKLACAWGGIIEVVAAGQSSNNVP